MPIRRLCAATFAAIVAVASALGSGNEARAGADHGSARILFTREDTTSIDTSEPFAPAGAIPVVGDFVGGTSDAGMLDDIFWYTPGAGGDAMWRTTGERSWLESTAGLSVNATYTPIVGSFTTGDAKQDIFWYAPGPTTDWLWDFNDDGTITKRSYRVNGTYTPIEGDFGDDGADDIIWYAPGPAPDSWWDFDAAGLTRRPFDVRGTYTPIVGSFAGIGSPTFDDAEDILWYAPGTAPDALWDLESDHSITKHPLTINGTFTPVAGDFTHDGFEDVLWYAPGTARDYLWDFDDATGGRTQTTPTINGRYTPLVGEVFETPDHRDDIVWFGPGAAADALWDFSETGTYVSRPVSLIGDLTPVLGRFEAWPYRPPGGGTSTGRGFDLLDRTR